MKVFFFLGFIWAAYLLYIVLLDIVAISFYLLDIGEKLFNDGNYFMVGVGIFYFRFL